MDEQLQWNFRVQIAIQAEMVLIAGERIALEVKGLFDGNPAFSTLTLWYSIQNMLNAAANISKACWGSGGSQTKERAALRERLEITDESPFRMTTMRNNFEHFDERIDRWYAASKDKNYVDLGITDDPTWHGFEPTDVFRQFNLATGDVIFWGDVFPLTPIMDEAHRILELIRKQDGGGHGGPPIPQPLGGG
jgi:hypothetical protein